MRTLRYAVTHASITSRKPSVVDNGKRKNDDIHSPFSDELDLRNDLINFSHFTIHIYHLRALGGGGPIYPILGWPSLMHQVRSISRSLRRRHPLLLNFRINRNIYMYIILWYLPFEAYCRWLYWICRTVTSCFRSCNTVKKITCISQRK